MIKILKKSLNVLISWGPQGKTLCFVRIIFAIFVTVADHIVGYTMAF